EREGHLLESASNGKEALRKIQEFQPQAILSDINMPQMDGITLLQEVNRFESPPPVILITAHGSEALAIQALRAGAYDYISKPLRGPSGDFRVLSSLGMKESPRNKR